MGRVTKKNDGKLTKNENDEVVKVTFNSFRTVIKYAGGWTGIFCLQFFQMLTMLISVLFDYTIGNWAKESNQNQQSRLKQYGSLLIGCAFVQALFCLASLVAIFSMNVRLSKFIH